MQAASRLVPRGVLWAWAWFCIYAGFLIQGHAAINRSAATFCGSGARKKGCNKGSSKGITLLTRNRDDPTFSVQAKEQSAKASDASRSQSEHLKYPPGLYHHAHSKDQATGSGQSKKKIDEQILKKQI